MCLQRDLINSLFENKWTFMPKKLMKSPGMLLQYGKNEKKVEGANYNEY